MCMYKTSWPFNEQFKLGGCRQGPKAALRSALALQSVITSYVATGNFARCAQRDGNLVTPPKYYLSSVPIGPGALDWKGAVSATSQKLCLELVVWSTTDKVNSYVTFITQLYIEHCTCTQCTLYTGDIASLWQCSNCPFSFWPHIYVWGAKVGDHRQLLSPQAELELGGIHEDYYDQLSTDQTCKIWSMCSARITRYWSRALLSWPTCNWSEHLCQLGKLRPVSSRLIRRCFFARRSLFIWHGTAANHSKWNKQLTISDKSAQHALISIYLNNVKCCE